MTPRKKKETPKDAKAAAADVALEPVAAEVAAPDATPASDEFATSGSILTYAPDETAVDDVVGATVVDQMIAFHLAGQRYGLPIDSVQEIQQIVSFSQQNGSGAVVGMVNLRGEVIPAIDVRSLLGLEHLDYNVNTPMIICRSEQGLVALVVDEVEDVITLPFDCVAVPPKLHNLADRMIGVCRLGTDLVYLLDVERLVAPLGLTTGGGW
ncbi:MAG: chemotaxis protein CheW [Coriobacteriia bacterium]